MRYQGLKPEAAQEISKLAKADGMNGAEAAFKEAWTARTQEDIQEGARLYETHKAMQEAAQRSAELPTLDQVGDQWVIREKDGSINSRWDDAETAQKHWQGRVNWEMNGQSPYVRSLIAWHRERVTKGKASYEVTGLTKTAKDVLNESFESAEAIGERMSLAGLEGQDPSTLYVKGENIPAIREGMYKGVIKLNNGSDVLDVIEEGAHDMLNRDIHEGRITWDQAHAAARMWYEAQGKPRGDEPLTTMEVHEAAAEMVKEHFVDNLGILNSLPQPMREFIKRFAEYVRGMLGNSKKLMELRDAGKIDKDWEGYLARAIGLDETVTHNRKAAEVAGGIQGVEMRNFSIGQKNKTRDKIKIDYEDVTGRVDSEARKAASGNATGPLKLAADDIRGKLRAILERDQRYAGKGIGYGAERADLKAAYEWAKENGKLVNLEEFTQQLIGEGSEHLVYKHPSDASRVVKVTKPNKAGLDTIWGEYGTDAIVPDYFERIDVFNRVFEDDVRIEGISQRMVNGKLETQIVTSQKEIKGEPLTLKQEGEVLNFLQDWGFESILASDNEIWYHPYEKVALADASTDNFVKTPEGKLVPIDLLMQPFDADVYQRTEGSIVRNLIEGVNYSIGKQTETPEFKRWFDGSKIVDEQGKPLVVYHGSYAPGGIEDFKFREEKNGLKTAYFTSDAGVAGEYALRFGTPEEYAKDYGADAAGEIAPATVPVFLALKTPFEVDAKGETWGRVNERALDEAKVAGADGLIIRNVVDQPGGTENPRPVDVFVAFEPGQIKSATGNSGAFDGGDPRINYSIGRQEPERNAQKIGIVTTTLDKAPKATGAVLKKWLNQFRGEHQNADTGWNLRVNEKTARHLVNQHGAAWRDALAELPSVIRDAVWLGRDEHKDFSSGGKVKWQHRFYGIVDISGEKMLLKLRVNETKGSDNLYDIKGAEAKKPTAIKGSETPAISFHPTLAEFAELVKDAWPTDNIDIGSPRHEGRGINYSIGKVDYMGDMAKMFDGMARNPTERLAVAERAKEQLGKVRGRVNDLMRWQKEEAMQDERARQTKADVANLEAELETKLADLEEAKAQELAAMGERVTVRFGDRIDSAQTDRERKALERTAREAAYDAKRGIEKDFANQAKALKGQYSAEIKALKEKAMGADRVAKTEAAAKEQRDGLRQSIAALDAVMTALPPEVRAKIGGFSALAKLTTDASRQKFFIERYEKIDAALEKHLQTQYREKFDKLLERSQPKMGDNRVLKSSLGAEAQEAAREIERYAGMNASELAGELAGLETRIAKTADPKELADLSQKWAWANEFGNIEGLSAAELASATRHFEELLTQGRNKWKIQEEARLEAMREKRAGFLAEMNRPNGVTPSDLQRAKERDRTLGAKALAAVKGNTVPHRFQKPAKNRPFLFYPVIPDCNTFVPL